VDYVIGEVRDGIRNVTPKHTFVYRDGTRTVFHTAVGGPEGRTNIFEIDPPNQPVPPHSVWRLALFEFWSNRFDDPKGPGRISYQKAAKLANTVGIERIELKGPRTLLFVLKENATEEIEFDESGLIVSQVTTHGSDEHRIAQKVTAVERSDGIPLPKRITTRSWDLKRPGSPLVQQGSTEIWVHAINQDVPDSEFAVPDIYPRTQIDYRDQSIRAFDKDGKELYSVPIRSAEQIHRDLTPLPPEPFSWWPTVAALALLAGIGLALLAWRRSTQSA
jgi:hypothetical protein